MTNYELDRLGWLEFENLIKAILKVRFGDGVEVCGKIHDGGREAFFNGSLKYPRKREKSEGPFFFQCKFIENAVSLAGKAAKQLNQQISSEVAMIKKRLAGKTRFKWVAKPKHYILFTNVELNASARESARSLLSRVLPSCEIHIHPKSDVCAWINAAPQVIVRFPQLFSIADFREILRAEVNKDIYHRSETAVKLAERIALAFVPTQPYRDALAKLSEHNFVILEGPPEMGKTSIARMIALAHFKGKWEAIECKQPKDILASYKNSTKQMFIADDCFGQTDYRADRVGAWQDELHYILPRLDKHHQVILTNT